MEKNLRKFGAIGMIALSFYHVKEISRAIAGRIARLISKFLQLG